MVHFPAPPVEGAVGALTLVSAWARCGAVVTLCVFPNYFVHVQFCAIWRFSGCAFSLDFYVFFVTVLIHRLWLKTWSV